MEVVMKTSTSLKVLGSVTLLALSALGCADQTPAPTSSGGSGAVTGNVALEAALADAESGKNPDRAQQALEAFVSAGTLSNEDRVRVDLALARLVEKTDRERAAQYLEDAIVLGDGAAEARLFELLTGSPPPAQRRADVVVAPIASVLANAFPAATPDRKVDVDVIQIGGNQRGGEDLGTFEIAGALRQKAFEACGGCADPRTNIQATRSHETRWTSIPRYASKLDHSLVVVYVDAETIVPERYAQWLAVPSADITAALDRNEGLIAVKERPNAPPLVTIAAPRSSLFHTVEASFASQKELPKEPMTVKLPNGLSPEEVHDVLGPRLSRAMSACAPERRGTDMFLDISYQIKGNGSVTDAHVGGKDGDPAVRACVEKAISSFQFPAWSKDPEAKSTEHIKIGVAVATSKDEALPDGVDPTADPLRAAMGLAVTPDGSYPTGDPLRADGAKHRVLRTLKKTMKESHETRVTK